MKERIERKKVRMRERERQKRDIREKEKRKEFACVLWVCVHVYILSCPAIVYHPSELVRSFQGHHTISGPPHRLSPSHAANEGVVIISVESKPS